MKKSIKYIWIPTMVVSMIILMAACEKTVETYDKFTKDGETVYIGVPDTVLVAPGFKKLRFSVVVNADPKISKGVLQTKDKSISHEFEVVRQNIGRDTIKFDLDLDQGEYNFDVFLKDNSGNQSLFREVAAVVYGENYVGGLLTRPITGVQAFSDRAIIEWGAAGSGTISTTLTYEDASGAMQTLDVPNDDAITTVESYKLESQIMAVSMFKPTENAIETFESNQVTAMFPDKFRLDFALIAPLELAFDATGGCFGSSYDKLTDGSTAEFWHSCEVPSDQYPFVMSFDLGVTAQLKGFRLDERPGNGERSPATFQIWGTNDLSGGDTVDINADTTADWEADATAKGWVKLLDVSDNSDMTFEVGIPENPMNYRYIRIAFIAAIDGGLWANFNELTFMASKID